MPERFYRPELDVVRFFAFVTVFVHHLAPPITGESDALVAFKESLGFGLCLFFTLSAYLITMLLLREKDATGTVSLTKFYKRRLLRIWPLYFAAIGFGALLALLEGKLHTQWHWFALALVMAGNAIPWPETVMAHMWSISVEEQFYVLWPGIAKHLSKKSLVLGAVVMLLISNTALVYFGRIHAETDPRVWSNSLVQFEMFAAGILLAIFDAKLKPAIWNRVLFLAIVPIAWFVADNLFHIKIYQLPARSALSLCAGYGIVAISCCMVIFALKGLHRWPKWMVYLGKISYGLYVFHGPMIRSVHKLSFAPRFALALGFTIVLASLSYRFYETPFLRMKEKLEVIHSRPVESA